MTTATTSKKATQTPEELEAAAQEQIVPISKDGLKKVRRKHAIRANLKRLKVEEEKIDEDLKSEMAEKHAKSLAYKGVVAVAIEDTTSVKTNSKQLFLDYPQLEAVYVTKDTEATRFVLKALV